MKGELCIVAIIGEFDKTKIYGSSSEMRMLGATRESENLFLFNWF